MTHDPAPLAAERLIHGAFGGLAPFTERMARLNQALDHLTEAGDEATETAVRKLRRQIREFEPSVTMIGQVKAGKTSLVNAMVGRPGLLPADINPWTSVVTSLHVTPGNRAGGQRAQFRFFSEEEWANLLNKGGRVGELAARAGADRELEKVRRQLEEMREKSRARLGRKFEMLLGQTHDYGYVDEALIQRYVCLGDDFADDTNADQSQGRFADITKSADLHLGQAALPMPLCIRDTPGVNDTFMVREQITVNAIRASRLCVVVLSAHQALSTVDMALIRLIANIRSREVILFVNRVDELADPAREIPEIRASIHATLKDHNGPAEAEILFGSAFWANRALSGDLHGLGQASADALINLAEDAVRRGIDHEDAEHMVWELSGVPALGRAIAERIVSGEGAAFADAATGAARNIATGLEASSALIARRVGGGAARAVSPDAIAQEINALLDIRRAALAAQFDTLMTAFDDRLDSSRRTFLSRATASLIAHLEDRGDGEVWTYDPAGLRVLLRSGYQVFTGKAARVCATAMAQAAHSLEALLSDRFNLPEDLLDLTPPTLPDPPVPVMLGQTIALDIKGNWWSRWWRRRRSYDAFADEFSDLINAEIAPMVEALGTDHAQVYRDTALALLEGFITAQRAALLRLAGQTEATLDQLRDRLSDDAEGRARHRAMAARMLAELAPRPPQSPTRSAAE